MSHFFFVCVLVVELVGVGSVIRYMTIHDLKCSHNMKSHIDIVGSVMFVERISRYQETLAKKKLNLYDLSIPLPGIFQDPSYG